MKLRRRTAVRRRRAGRGQGLPLVGGGIEATRIEIERATGALVPALMSWHGRGDAGRRHGRRVDDRRLDRERRPTRPGWRTVGRRGGANVRVKGWAQADGTVEAGNEDGAERAERFRRPGFTALESFSTRTSYGFFVTASKSEILRSMRVRSSTRRCGTARRSGWRADCRVPVRRMPAEGPDSHFFTVSAPSASR